jgi:small subunit ribosomal protein S8
MVTDLVNKINNAIKVKKQFVEVNDSRYIQSFLVVLKKQGYIADFTSKEVRKGVSTITVNLKYNNDESVIEGIKQISKQSLRKYSGVDELPKILNGLGTVIVSTPKGMMTGKEAKKVRLGGEVIAYV